MGALSTVEQPAPDAATTGFYCGCCGLVIANADTTAR